MAKFLGETGLTALWGKIGSTFIKKDSGTAASPEAVSGVKQFTNGLFLNSASSWTSSDRAIPFSANGSPQLIQYISTTLTFNPNTKVLKVNGNEVLHSGNFSSASFADSTPTQNSTKLITSGGVYSALNTIETSYVKTEGEGVITSTAPTSTETFAFMGMELVGHAANYNPGGGYVTGYNPHPGWAINPAGNVYASRYLGCDWDSTNSTYTASWPLIGDTGHGALMFGYIEGYDGNDIDTANNTWSIDCSSGEAWFAADLSVEGDARFSSDLSVEGDIFIGTDTIDYHYADKWFPDVFGSSASTGTSSSPCNAATTNNATRSLSSSDIVKGFVAMIYHSAACYYTATNNPTINIAGSGAKQIQFGVGQQGISITAGNVVLYKYNGAKWSIVRQFAIPSTSRLRLLFDMNAEPTPITNGEIDTILAS